MIRQNHLKLFYFTMFFFIFKLSLFSDVDVTGTIKTAYLKDAYEISGVHYQCNNGTLKTTGTDGSFSYDNTCSTITFSISNNKVILNKISS